MSKVVRWKWSPGSGRRIYTDLEWEAVKGLYSGPDWTVEEYGSEWDELHARVARAVGPINPQEEEGSE